MALNTELPVGGATGPAFAPAKSQEPMKDASQRQAWNREMERAQLEAWLSHDAIGGKRAPNLPAELASLPAPLGLPTAIGPALAPAHEQAAAAVAAQPLERPPRAASIAWGSVHVAQGHTQKTEALPETESARNTVQDRVASAHPVVAAPFQASVDRDPKLQALAQTRAQVRTAELAAVLGNEGIVKASFAVRGPVADPVATHGAHEQSPIQSPIPGAVSAAEDGPSTLPEQAAMQPVAAPIILGAPPPPTLAVARSVLAGEAANVTASKVGNPAIASPGRPDPFAFGTTRVSFDADAGEPTDSPMRYTPRVASPKTGSVTTESAETPREPIRLHAEWAAEGVSLWLALDAPVLNQAPFMLAQLQRWLAIQGIALLHASCNGKPLTQAEPPAHNDHNDDQQAAPHSHDSSQENS